MRQMLGNAGRRIGRMDARERLILERLDAAVREPHARRVIDETAGRLRERLEGDPAAPMTWAPVPLEAYTSLPELIRSSWVFVLRRNTTSGAERHPNSHQRVMSLCHTADLQTWEGGRWRSNVLVSDAAAPLERRWLSIPVNVWHQPVMTGGDWVVVSFHTVEAAELIEERPTGKPDEPGTKRRRYLEHLTE